MEREFIYTDASLDDSGEVSGDGRASTENDLKPRRRQNRCVLRPFRGWLLRRYNFDSGRHPESGVMIPVARLLLGPGMAAVCILQDTPEALVFAVPRPADTALWRDTKHANGQWNATQL